MIQSVPVTLSCHKNQHATNHATYFLAMKVSARRLNLFAIFVFRNVVDIAPVHFGSVLAVYRTGFLFLAIQKTSATTGAIT